MNAIDVPFLEVNENNTTLGVTGIQKGNVERVKLPIRDSMENVNTFDFKVSKNDSAIEQSTSKIYRDSCCEELQIPENLLHNFNFQEYKQPIFLLIGLNNPHAMPREINPRALNLSYPVTSPNLKLLQTPLSKQILIAGSLGLYHELFSETQPIFFKPRETTAIQQRLFFVLKILIHPQ